MVKSSNKKQPKKVGITSNKNKVINNTKKKWNQKRKVHHHQNRNKNRNYNKNKRQNMHNKRSHLNLSQLKKLRKRKPKKETKVRLNKTENIFNLSIVKSLNKQLIDFEVLKQDETEHEDEQNDHSPKSPSPVMDIDDDTSHAIKLSNAPSHYEPGTMVDLPQQINVRSWKTVHNTHNSKLIEFNPKSAPSFAHSMYDKKTKKDMKAIENQLRDEIRADKQLEKMKKQQRLEMRKQNMLRGTVVKPIRNMHKLKNFTKKQWRTVMKASVEIHNPKNSVRATFVPRENLI